MARAPALLLPLALLAAADDPLAGRVAGAATQCIPVNDATTLRILGPRTVAWQRTERRWWVSHARGQCRPLRVGDTVAVAPGAGRLCRDDRFRTRSPGDITFSAPCRFDSFIPYDKAETAR